MTTHPVTRIFLYGIGPTTKGRVIAMIDDSLVESAARLFGGAARHVGAHACAQVTPFVELFHEHSLAGRFIAGVNFAEKVAPYSLGDHSDIVFFFIGSHGRILPKRCVSMRAA